MLTVAMVLRSGGDYGPEYVRRLCQGVRRHLKAPHQIVCLSDDPTVGEWSIWKPLKTDWTGWWCKLELFREFRGRTLYFDLDTVIRGDITPLVERRHRFTMLSDLLFPARPASGVMAWEGDYSYLADGFDMAVAEDYRVTECWGDQGWIMRRLGFEPDRFQSLYPGMIASRKKSTAGERRNASIICYHGRPRPHTTGWDDGVAEMEVAGG